MDKLRLIYGTGCWLFGIVTGVGHLIFELAPRDARGGELAELLRSFAISMPGTQTTAFLLFSGISLLMGLMLVGYGVMNLLVLHKTPKGAVPDRSFQLVNVLFSFTAFLLAWNYLFILPIALIGISFVCFLIVFVFGQIYGNAKQPQK